jgi:hypothetical protein
MSTDRLGAALSDLVDDVEDGLAPPSSGDLWAGGRRRRLTARLVPVLVAACVAALVGLIVWPGAAPRAAVPAVGVDDAGAVHLTAFPSTIAKPPFVGATGRPGVTAAVVATHGDVGELFAASPRGAVTRLVLPDAPLGTSGQPALSPDGRWLARGFVLTDLVRGATLPSLPVRQGLESSRMPAEGTDWWSPDSRRVYVDAINQGLPRSSGFVVATDGTVTEAPLLAGGQVPVVAGWLDDDTVLAFVDVGSPGARGLEGRTWRVGEPTWEVSVPDLEPNADGEVFDASGLLRADLSPDRRRVLLTEGILDPATNQASSTRATVYDVRTGANAGPPDDESSGTDPTVFPHTSLTWDGWGCRPAWRLGEPVITDGTVRTTAPAIDTGPVAVSSRYESPCVSFAGDELRGVGLRNSAAVWQERAWVWGTRLLVAVPLVLLAGWFLRRRSWREGSQAPQAFLPPSRG